MSNKKVCKVCGRKFEFGVSAKVCSNSCVQIAQIVRKKGHR